MMPHPENNSGNGPSGSPWIWTPPTPQRTPMYGVTGTWNVPTPAAPNNPQTATNADNPASSTPRATPMARADETSIAWQLLVNTQAEMASLRQQLTQLQLSPPMPVRRESIEVPLNAIPNFDPDLPTSPTAFNWVRRIDELRLAHGWSESMCMARALGRLEGTARVWFDTVAADITSWEQLSNAVVRAFPIYDDVAGIHAQLAAKRKTSQETHAAYAYAMLSLARRGRIEERDVVGYILRGVDSATSTALAALQIDTIEQLLAAIARFQARTTSPPVAEPSTTTKKTSKVPSPPPERRVPACSNCGARDHSTRECRKGMRCYECNRFGHRAAECRQRKAAAKPRVNIINCSFRKRILINDIEHEALLDTGADCNLVSTRFASELRPVGRPCEVTLAGFGGAEVRCKQQVTFRAIIDDNEYNIDAVVVPEHASPTDVVLGGPWLSRTRFRYEKGSVKFQRAEDSTTNPSDISLAQEKEGRRKANEKRARIDDQATALRQHYAGQADQLKRLTEEANQLRQRVQKLGQESSRLNEQLARREEDKNAAAASQPTHDEYCEERKPRPEIIIKCEPPTDAEQVREDVCPEMMQIMLTDTQPTTPVTDFDDSHLTEEQRIKIRDLIRNYKPKLTHTVRTKTRITVTNPKPVALPPRRLAPAERAEVERQVETWLKEDIIQPSTSDYSSPVVLVRKKDGSMRMCVDYRLLNQRVARDQFPMPQIDDQLDRLQRSRVFSTLDLKNGFLHVPVSEASQKYTAFATPSGLYEFKRTPYGFCNSPASFSRFVAEIFRPLITSGVVAIYVDDVVILSKDETEAIERLQQVLEHAAGYGLNINWSKCQFIQKRIRFLGYEIENGELHPDPDKIRAVARFPPPSDVPQLRRFLGLAGYFRRFIAHYSMIAKPLTILLKKDTEFVFGPDQKAAFEQLKKCLCESPVLSIYDPQAYETQLHTDASQLGLAALLLQRKSQRDQLRPVHYFAKTTTPVQQKYSAYELEVLAVVEALKRFRIYLLGLRFTIVTDCSAFQLTMTKKEMSTRVARWALMLGDYDYRIEHRPGTAMKHADALSRVNVMTVTGSTMLYKIRQAMSEDDEAQRIMTRLQEGTNEGFQSKNGLLYRVKDGRELLYVPRKLQFDLIRRTHESGHFAVRKTVAAFKQQYWAPKLSEKVQKVIEHCIPCVLGTEKRGRQEGLLQPIDKSGGPLHTLHVDHVGPLVTSPKGYRHLLAVIDAFTKYVWLFPVKSTTAAETLRKIKLVQTVFGNPHRIVTDRGTAFTSREFKRYCEEEKVHHVLVTTGVPRGNGQVERLHRIVKEIITKRSNESPEQWYRYVPQTQRIINGSFQRSIQTSPFELMFGVRIRSSDDIELGRDLEEAIRTEFLEDRDQLRLQARRQLFEVQEESRRTFNKTRKRPHLYQVGDLTAIKRTQFTTEGKFKNPYFGPYRITAVRGKDRYEVEKVGEGEGPIRSTASADHLKLWPAPEELESVIDDDRPDDHDAPNDPGVDVPPNYLESEDEPPAQIETNLPPDVYDHDNEIAMSPEGEPKGIPLSIPPPRKRGRPRRSEDARKAGMAELWDPVKFTARSSRMRRKVRQCACPGCE